MASGLVSPSMCCNLQGLIGEYLYEDPYYDSKLFCLRLIEIASKEKCSYLLPVHEEVFPILEHIDLFIKAGIEVISPTLEEILQLHDKASVYDLAIQTKIKRIYSLKDYSNLLGPHGGVIDRIDSLTLVAMSLPLIYEVIG